MSKLLKSKKKEKSLYINVAV